MSQEFKIEIVNPEKSFFSKGDVTEVVVPAFEGEMGILKDHISIISFLKPGIVTIYSKLREEKFYLEDGIIEFKNNNLSILTSSIYNLKELEKKKKKNLIKLEKEELKYEVCRNDESSINLLIPIPLSFQKDQIKIIQSKELIASVAIENKIYRESRIVIENQDLVTPPEFFKERIKKEYSKGINLKNILTLKKKTSKEMILPLKGLRSSEFGVRRFINGQPRNRHTGLDLAADEGVSIVVPLKGKVILADSFFYKGNVIYIDHGNGLITSYSHLSKKLVAEGQSVSKGERLGLVGSTGRVTGPHLHWEVYFLGIPINPEIGRQGDLGLPIVEKNPDDETSQIFINFAKKIKSIYFNLNS